MVLAKPVKDPGITLVDNAFIKPPYTLRAIMPSLPPSVPTGYDMIEYIVDLWYCKESNYDPSTGRCSTKDHGVVLKVQAVGSLISVLIGMADYYTGSGLVEGKVASNLLLGSQYIFDLNLTGCNLSLTINGKQYIYTNMFKPVEPLSLIVFKGNAYRSGSTVDPPDPFNSAWVVDVIQQLDISALINMVVIVAVATAIASTVVLTLTKALK